MRFFQNSILSRFLQEQFTSFTFHVTNHEFFPQLLHRFSFAVFLRFSAIWFSHIFFTIADYSPIYFGTTFTLILVLIVFFASPSANCPPPQLLKEVGWQLAGELPSLCEQYAALDYAEGVAAGPSCFNTMCKRNGIQGPKSVWKNLIVLNYPFFTTSFVTLHTDIINISQIFMFT